MSKELNYIRNYTDFVPETAIILGSGLGDLADICEVNFSFNYKDIPNMPVSTAPSHKGRLILGKLSGKNVVIMQGRIHLYEGYAPQDILTPIRLMKDLGAKNIIITNAAGGINRNYKAGDLMMIKDHISCFIDSCLIGKNDDNYGVRFPDMSDIYNTDIREKVINIAKVNNIKLHQGIFIQLKGPQFESPAEIRMLEKLGADAVGMSTAIDAIAAKHCGMNVCGITLISNMACGISDKPLSSEEVTIEAEKAAPKFQKLILEIIKEL